MCSFASKYVPLIRTLKLEPFVFLIQLSMTLKAVTIVQLYQDKLCAVDYGYDAEFCKDLYANDSVTLSRKSQVLGNASLYQIYQALVTTIPIAFCSLFIGCWIDKYYNSTKLLLIMAAIGGIGESALLMLNSLFFDWTTSVVLISFIPTALAGSNVYMLMAAFSYIPKTTAEHLRSIRYAIMDFAIFIGTPIGLYVGGIVIHMAPIGQKSLHNYIGVFLLVSLCNILGLIWVFIAFRNKNNEMTVINDDAESNGSIVTGYGALKHIFELENVKETLRTCFRSRPNQGKLQLWLLISALYIVIMTGFGQVDVIFQFTERVYGWHAGEFSSVNAIGSIASNLTQAIFVVILVKSFKMKDIRLAIIGVVSLLLQVIMRGSILTPLSLYLSYVVGGVSGMATIGIRSFISRLVERKELGKVFCFMAALESTQPLTSNMIFASLFKIFVEKRPGLVFQILAVPLFYSLIAPIIIELFYERNDPEKSTTEDMEAPKMSPIKVAAHND